jgi:hypothetical protein
MYKVLNTAEIPDGCGVAIEFGVPYTSSRIDFLLTGRGNGIADSPATDSAIIIELKQWESLEASREGQIDLLLYPLDYCFQTGLCSQPSGNPIRPRGKSE